LLIEIDKNDFSQVLKIIKLRNNTLYNKIKDIKPFTHTDTLTTARNIKTNRIKEGIKSTLRELIQSNIKPSKYKVHKSTNIAYITLNKYYNDILDEVQNEQ
jgi:hypothetical protein